MCRHNFLHLLASLLHTITLTTTFRTGHAFRGDPIVAVEDILHLLICTIGFSEIRAAAILVSLSCINCHSRVSRDSSGLHIPFDYYTFVDINSYNLCLVHLNSGFNLLGDIASTADTFL